jgi:hypothetical protein
MNLQMLENYNLIIANQDKLIRVSPGRVVYISSDGNVFVTQAADVGSNNYGIVGDFVLAGE